MVVGALLLLEASWCRRSVEFFCCLLVEFFCWRLVEFLLLEAVIAGISTSDFSQNLRNLSCTSRVLGLEAFGCIGVMWLEAYGCCLLVEFCCLRGTTLV